MDIENLRKIQETEKALRIHNINISTREAIDNMRNDIDVGGTRVPVFENISEETQKASPTGITQQQKEVVHMDEQLIRKMNNQIEEQSEMLAKQAKMIYDIQGAINEIIKEINKIQSSVPTKNPAERQVVLKPEERTTHPRSGGYTPADVSVEKFFNFSGTR